MTAQHRTARPLPGRGRLAPARAAAIALVTMLAGLAGLPGPAAAQQEVVRDTYGAWNVRCAEGTETCVMQQVGKGAEGNDVLEMRIRKIEGVNAPDGEAIPAAIQILAPLGVLLPAGVRVQVDGNEVRSAPFEVCAAGGCVVRQPMSEAFLNEMKAGSTAKVTLIAAPQNEVVISISLSGFTRAFGNIDP
ncbi:MAG: invasion associated locus B family protein [Pseudomonadota bacterium]